MSNHKLLIFIGVSIASFLSSWLPAIAQPNLNYNGAYIYKDAKDNIYIISNAEQRLTYDNVVITKAPYSDACGFISLRLSNADISFPSSISFNGTSSSLGSIPTVTEKTPYKCVNGVPKWNGAAQTSVFQTSVTNVIGDFQVKNIYYPSSVTGGASKQGMIAYTGSVIKNVKPNACGFVVTPGYANSQKKTSATVRRNSTPINVATLPVNPNPPDCVGGKTLTGGATAVATFNGASLYRTIKNIYFTGLTPNSLNVVNYDALQSKTVSIDNTCGMVKIEYREVPTAIKVGATTYTPATMPLSSSDPFYTCTSPGYDALAANTLYKRNNKDYVYKTSDLTLKKMVAENPIVISKNIAVNACGFAVIPALNTVNGFTTGDKVAINGSTPYTVTTLPLAPSGPTCKNGVTYLVSP